MAIAGASLGWNIYKEYAFRAQVIVSMSIVKLFPPIDGSDNEYIVVRCVNKGPGPVTLGGICCQCVDLSTLGSVKTGHAVINFVGFRWGGDNLPKRLEISETARFFAPFSTDCFLSLDLKQVTVWDSYNRDHKIPIAQIRAARNRYVEQFYNASSSQSTDAIN